MIKKIHITLKNKNIEITNIDVQFIRKILIKYLKNIKIEDVNEINKIIKSNKNKIDDKIIDLYISSNNKIFKNIKSINDIYKIISQVDYGGSMIDLVFLSKLFKFNFIICNDNNLLNTNIIECLISSDNEYFILIYKQEIDTKLSFYNINLNDGTYIFKQNYIPLQLMNIIKGSCNYAIYNKQNNTILKIPKKISIKNL